MSKICLYSSVFSECHTRTLPLCQNTNIVQFAIKHIEEWKRQLKITPTDCFSATFVVTNQALDNPFVPNLKEHLSIPETSVFALHIAKKAAILFTCGLILFLPVFVLGASPPGVKQLPCQFWATWSTVAICILIASGIILTCRNYDQRIKRVLADRRKSLSSVECVRTQGVDTP